jgi:hypothetical protein
MSIPNSFFSWLQETNRSAKNVIGSKILFIRKRNIIEIPAAAGKLREIIKGNTMEIHSASLREIN